MQIIPPRYRIPENVKPSPRPLLRRPISRLNAPQSVAVVIAAVVLVAVLTIQGEPLGALAVGVLALVFATAVQE